MRAVGSLPILRIITLLAVVGCSEESIGGPPVHSSSLDIAPTGNVDQVVTASVPATAKAEDPIRFSFTVTNEGPDPAPAPVFETSIPPALRASGSSDR